jgi:hypothetical protein
MGICLYPEQQQHNLEIINNTPETQITVMYFDYYYLYLYLLYTFYYTFIHISVNNTFTSYTQNNAITIIYKRRSISETFH